MKTKVIAVFILFTLLVSGIVCAGNDVEKEILNKLFTYDKDKIGELFDQSFLEKIPVSKIIQEIKSYKNQLGELEKIEDIKKGYKLIFENGSAPAYLNLTKDKKIGLISIGDYTLNKDNLNDIMEEFKNLDGTVSVTVLKNNQDLILGYNENKEMAVGSAFKLYVLKAVYSRINFSEKSWDDVLILNEDNMSLPSGISQYWQVGTPVTIKVLTNLMIHLSDNTATDHLIDFVGRDAVEKIVSDKNKPFIKTNEMFKLKYLASSKIQTDYMQGSIEEKRNILQLIKGYGVEKANINSNPTLINEIEWFFSTKELCNIIYELKDTGEIQINPGLVKKDDWFLVGYKGGSEPGVLQGTHILQKDKNGDIYTVSVTINNPDNNVNKSKFIELTKRLISQIKKW